LIGEGVSRGTDRIAGRTAEDMIVRGPRPPNVGQAPATPQQREAVRRAGSRIQVGRWVLRGVARFSGVAGAAATGFQVGMQTMARQACSHIKSDSWEPNE